MNRFFSAFYTGNIAAIREAVSTGFTMEGPFAAAHNVDELIELSKGLFQIVRGHKVLHWIVQGDQVSALYEIKIEGPAGIGALTTGGWFTVTADRVIYGRVIYDSAQFDAIVSPS